MSSTTSSDCESCDCSQCTYSFENNHNDYGKLLMNSRHVPMYTTVAHPLIYYAEVQQPLNRGQTYDQPRKENPFKKAFKWYTQERTLCNKNDVAPERSGFANWLDNKYAEYLCENGQQTKSPTSHEPRTQKTSIAESCPPCPGTTKKFGRFKSPWRKRRRSGNDSGDVPEKCPHESCEFLLQPKELRRAASETFYHTPTSGGKSNSTVASSNMHCNTKCSGRSHSLTDVAREKSVLKHGDTVPHAVQKCPNCQEHAPAKLATTSCACHQKQRPTKLLKSICVCPQEQGPSNAQAATNQPGPLCNCLQEKVAEVVKVPSKEQDATNKPGSLCKCLQEKIREVVKVPSKEQDATNQAEPLCKCFQKNVSIVVEVSSKEQDTTNQAEPCCNYPKEKVPEVVQVPTKAEAPTNQPKPLQEEVPKVPSKEQDPSNQLKPLQEKVPSKIQEPSRKVPKVVQVPSQSRAVEESCQYPEEKVVPVHEETQYEPAPEPPRSTQNLGPCCSKTCNKPIPTPPQMLCIPVKNNCHEVNQVFGPKPIRRESYSTVAINEETGEYSIVKEVAVVNKFTRSVTYASNEAAQTSDHSICFEQDACSGENQLFFKIICADISKNE